MKTVDVTPTWLGLLPMLLELTHPSINQDARQTAFRELARMAEAADNWNEYMKERCGDEDDEDDEDE